MAPQMEYVSKTQHYLKVKKPLLERERRARINKSLDNLKALVADMQGDDAILRMDKAEMLEAALAFVKKVVKKSKIPAASSSFVPMDSFRNGYINAVNEVSRVMAATPSMNVQLGKAVMIHLGGEYNRLKQVQTSTKEDVCSAPMSPASSGYHSDDCCDESSLPSPSRQAPMWRPW